VLPYSPRRNGGAWAFSRAEAGRTMAFISIAIFLDYTHFRAEPHILLFRRPLGTDPRTGMVE